MKTMIHFLEKVVLIKYISSFPLFQMSISQTAASGAHNCEINAVIYYNSWFPSQSSTVYAEGMILLTKYEDNPLAKTDGN